MWRSIGSIALAVGLSAVAAPVMAQVSYVGSSTIGNKIMPEAARVFTARTGVAVAGVQIQGSGVGIDLVARGLAPLAGSSRALSVAEKKLGLRYQIIGYDGMVVFVHASNRVKTLTPAELKGIFTGKIRHWSAVGGADAPITVITVHVAERRGQSVEFQAHTLDGQPYREDRQEVDGGQGEQALALASTPHGIAVVSSAFAVAGIRAIALDGYEPTMENVRSGAYVLSRPLVLVAPSHPTADVRRFLDFMLSAEGQAIVARHFVSIR
jgi:phosphate transport system substrate-binding protein